MSQVNDHFFNSRSQMKKLSIIFLITLFVVSMSRTALAQAATKTRSAQAAYGYPSEFKASKKKAKKQKKAAKRKAKTPINRSKKSPWVN
jgi:hypothetical protein